MTLRRQYLKALSALFAVGATGAASLLGGLLSAAAREEPAGPGAKTGVAEKLAAVRRAVSDTVNGSPTDDEESRQLAWWGNWRNGGWRNGGWRNGGGVWRNGGGGAWRNGGGGGWRNGGGGGWRNGGWPNFWRNW